MSWSSDSRSPTTRTGARGRDEPGERRREPLAQVRLCDRSLIADDLKRPAHMGFEHGSVAVLELLDRRSWTTRAELASAIFEWIEGWYNPRRRHTSIGDLSPVEYERRPAAAAEAA